MTSRRSTAALTALVAAAVVVVTVPAGSQPATIGNLKSDPDALDALEQAVATSRSASYAGTVVVVGFDGAGPSVAEVSVAQDDGDLRVSRSEAWTVGREGAQGYYIRAGELLRMGSVELATVDPATLDRKYLVRFDGDHELDTGSTTALAITEREERALRERLHIDDASGLVVRRETYRVDGTPTRLVAFTSLERRPAPLESLEPDLVANSRRLRQLSPEALDTLNDVGWHVPASLPDGFDLAGGFALPEGDGTSVHLVYSDGLYTLSLYEQVGRLDARALEGADELADEEVHAYHWPGSEPGRMVWGGDGMTYTVISDAPEETLVDVIEALPHDRSPSLLDRFGRGLGRVADLAWPF